MNTAKELCIILGISFLGECIGKLLPFPVPASIYGMFILFFALISGFLCLKQIEQTADGLLDMMPVLFVPAGAGLINNLNDLRQFLFPIILILFLTTIIVMAATGKTASVLISCKERMSGKNEKSV